MNLKNLVNIVKSGNMALGHKLNNLLTDNCSILEYTDDAVLFTQNNYLVLAKFNHKLSESKLSASDILDNEIIRISLNGTKKSLMEEIHNTINLLSEEDYVSAEKALKNFCETYYQYFVIKNRFPNVFVEKLNKHSKGFNLRKTAHGALQAFKSEIFSLVTITESTEADISEYTDLIEAYGHVLFLGKKVLTPIVVDALLGNEALAETFINTLFSVANDLSETNDKISDAVKAGYNLAEGHFDDEDPDDVAEEDLENEDFENEEEDEDLDLAGLDAEEDAGLENEATEFDVASLSDIEIKELHKDVLVGILQGMRDFVDREANDPEKTDIPADLDEKLKEDLAQLEDTEIADDVLSSIEARWQPILSYFLDSDMYNPDQELGGDDVTIEDVVPGGEDAETVEEPPTPETSGAPEEVAVPPVPEENLPPMGEAENTLPPAPLGTETPEEEKFPPTPRQ